MIEDTKDQTERALTQLLDDLVPVANMIIVPNDELLLVVIEAIVVLFLRQLAVGCPTR